MHWLIGYLMPTTVAPASSRYRLPGLILAIALIVIGPFVLTSIASRASLRAQEALVHSYELQLDMHLDGELVAVAARSAREEVDIAVGFLDVDEPGTHGDLVLETCGDGVDQGGHGGGADGRRGAVRDREQGRGGHARHATRRIERRGDVRVTGCHGLLTAWPSVL